VYVKAVRCKLKILLLRHEYYFSIKRSHKYKLNFALYIIQFDSIKVVIKIAPTLKRLHYRHTVGQ
jgi:hypothetical protein